MSDTTTETTEVVEDNLATEEPQPEGDISDVTPEGSDPESDPEPQSRREARYRTQLRETEAERDTLRATVESMQRREVERLAADHITKPAALWTAGTELAALLTDTGAVDPEKVATAAADARDQLGLEHPQAKRGPVVPREGTSYGRESAGNTWENAFRQ